MFCSNCGTQLDDTARFCPECGEKTHGGAPMPAFPDAPQPAPAGVAIEGRRITENIYLCPDGVYRWAYEFKLMKNPTILITLIKVMLLSAGITLAIVILMGLFAGDFEFEDVIGIVKVFAIIAVGVVVFSFIGYFIYAAIAGWKYCVLFEMDETGINHIQIDRSLKFAELMQSISIRALTVGLIAQPIVAGLLIRTSMRTDFPSVTLVKAKRGRQTIYVNAGLDHNQVYADKSDFDFVLNYIMSRVPANATRK